ncbi:MAG: hypothetical protein JWQ49_104 [Edaphobacter sp.]|nr:hypothetical protein [Edaphobacter sp.]
MNYEKPTFTLPASANTSQQTWDRAFLSEEEFRAKYPQTSSSRSK